MKFVLNTSHWDDDDYVVTIRPESEPISKAHPIGCAMSAQEAQMAENWLRTALRDLLVIGANIGKEAASQVTLNQS